MHRKQYNVGTYRFQVPLDILPPAPRQTTQKFVHVPFLFTSLAKEAFQTSSKAVPRPDSAEFTSRTGSRGTGSFPSSPSQRSTRRNGVYEDGTKSAMGMHSDKKDFALRMPGDPGRTTSGRISAPPMMNYSADKSLLDLSRRSLDKSKSKLTKKRPEIFVLEAEQVRQMPSISILMCVCQCTCVCDCVHVWLRVSGVCVCMCMCECLYVLRA
jgi:hypothetical protein